MASSETMRMAAGAMGALLWPGALMADVAMPGRTSPNYSVEMDTLASLSGLAMSQAYEHIIGGGESAGGAAASPAYAHRGGYVGKLYDVLEVTFPASPLEVPELSSHELRLQERWDDATRWMPPAASAQWTLLFGGEYATLTIGGQLDTQAVYQPSALLLRAVRGPWNVLLTVVVQDTVPDNFGSYAGDGLSDVWQVKNFGLNDPQAGPLADPDGDGSDNQSEYFALTDPRDPTSVFVAVMEPDGAGGLRLSFLSVVARRYWLEASSSLTPDSWSEIAGPLAGTGGVLFFNLPSGSEPQQLFRIRMRP